MTHTEILHALKLATAEQLAAELSSRRKSKHGGRKPSCGHTAPDSACPLCQHRTRVAEWRQKRAGAG